MKIVFICGGLEPGKDGVGDYTRRLAEELVKNDHQVLMISINDKFIEGSYPKQYELERSIVPALRLSEKISQSKRIKLAKHKIDVFDPDYLSLQYVPFSFHKKGLPFKFARRLSQLGKNRKWHIMFHELWVGMNKEASFKYKIWGAVQKKIIKDTIAVLNPVLIDTQSRYHKCQLENLGYKVKFLPLFSNFEVYYKKQNDTSKDTLKFLVFGSIHPGAPVESFANEVYRYGKKYQKKIRFIFLGRCLGDLENWVKVCENKQFEVKILGEQNPHKISKVLSTADFGVSSTPFYLHEKSGTIVAMKEHMLPILCVAKKYTPTIKVPHFPLEITEYKPNYLDLTSDKCMGIQKTLENIAQEFSENLRLAEKNNKQYVNP